MNLKQQLPNFDTIRDLGISCDGNQVTATVTKVLFSKLTEFLFFIFRYALISILFSRITIPQTQTFICGI